MLGDFVRYRVSRQFCRQITRQQLPTLPMPLCPHRPTLAFYTYYPYSFLVYLIALIHCLRLRGLLITWWKLHLLQNLFVGYPVH